MSTVNKCTRIGGCLLLIGMDKCCCQDGSCDYKEPMEFCEECNSPLSDCGSENPDGTPSSDCKVCQLRARVAELEESNRLLKEQIRVADVAFNFQMEQKAGLEKDKERLDWLDENYHDDRFLFRLNQNPRQVIDAAMKGGSK